MCAGWHLPGGGVETGETLADGARRANCARRAISRSIEPPELFAVYFNRRISRRDHVALYIVRSFRQSAPPQPNHEIIAHGFFAPDALPADTTRATRARIAEVLSGRDAGGTLVRASRDLSNRPRSCGAVKSSCGPIGTMPVGFTWRWLP